MLGLVVREKQLSEARGGANNTTVCTSCDVSRSPWQQQQQQLISDYLGMCAAQRCTAHCVWSENFGLHWHLITLGLFATSAASSDQRRWSGIRRNIRPNETALVNSTLRVQHIVISQHFSSSRVKTGLCHAGTIPLCSETFACASNVVLFCTACMLHWPRRPTGFL